MLQKGCKFIRCFCKCVTFGLLHSWHQYRMYTTNGPLLLDGMYPAAKKLGPISMPRVLQP